LRKSTEVQDCSFKPQMVSQPEPPIRRSHLGSLGGDNVTSTTIHTEMEEDEVKHKTKKPAVPGLDRERKQLVKHVTRLSIPKMRREIEER
jgi:hypothetical protein